MMTANYGHEFADIHFKELFEQAERDRLVGCLKRQRRERAHAARRKAQQPCPQDLG